MDTLEKPDVDNAKNVGYYNYMQCNVVNPYPPSELLMFSFSSFQYNVAIHSDIKVITSDSK